MTTEPINLSPPRQDLRFTRGDDVDLRLAFNTDLTGWTGWEAKATNGLEAGSATVTFAVDSTQQASRVIVIAVDTVNVSTGWRWSFKVSTPAGPVTICAGWLIVDDEPTSV